VGYISTAERRQQLLDAAAQVIREHGLTNATTRRIADAAGAPLASVHHCFPHGKDELYEAVMEDLGVDGLNQLDHAVSAGMGVAAAAEAIFRRAVRWSNDTYDDQLTAYEIYIWAIRSRDFASIPKQSYDSWISHIARLCQIARREDEAEYNYDLLARVLVVQIDGFIIQHQMLQTKQRGALTSKGVELIAAAIASGTFDLP